MAASALVAARRQVREKRVALEEARRARVKQVDGKVEAFLLAGVELQQKREDLEAAKAAVVQAESGVGEALADVVELEESDEVVMTLTGVAGKEVTAARALAKKRRPRSGESTTPAEPGTADTGAE